MRAGGFMDRHLDALSIAVLLVTFAFVSTCAACAIEPELIHVLMEA